MKQFAAFSTLVLFCIFLGWMDCTPPTNSTGTNSAGMNSVGTNSVETNSAGTNSAGDEQSIRDCHSRYATAILNDDAEGAFQCVDKRTLEYYSKSLSQIKTATKAEVRNLAFIDKVIVLTVRHKAPKETVLAMKDGKDLFLYAVRNGMVGKDSVAGQKLGEIIVDGDFAKTHIVVNGKEAPFGFHFYREDGVWKIDLTSVHSVASGALTQVAKDSGMTEDEFLMLTLEHSSGKAPDDSVWEPLEP